MHSEKQNCDFNYELEHKNQKFAAICFEWIESGIQAIIIVVLLMSFVFRIVSVSGESMLNTLHNNDKLIIVRLRYVPHNGDVIVIKRGGKINSPLIKRIIALEGQKLRIDYQQGSIFIDGKQIIEPYIKEKMWLRGDVNLSEDIIIPKNMCFVMGDNRNNSTDSRFSDVGLIPYEDIIGKASLIVHPIGRIGII